MPDSSVPDIGWRVKGRAFAERELRRMGSPRQFWISHLLKVTDESLRDAVEREFRDLLQAVRWTALWLAEPVALVTPEMAAAAESEAMDLILSGFRERLAEMDLALQKGQNPW